MKILYVQDSLGTGGAERSNAELWYYLRKNKVSIRIIVLEHREEGLEREMIDNGFNVEFIKAQNFISQSKEIAGIINSWKPDIVHSVLLRSTWRVRLAKMFTSFIHVESLVNCTYEKIRLKDPQIYWLKLKAYELRDRYSHFGGTDKFIAITQEVERHHIEHLKIPPEDISVIYRGRKKNPFLEKKEMARNDLRLELHFKQDDLIFVHVGRQEYQKGIINLLKGIKICDQILSSLNVKFIFCGRKGNASPEIESFINEEHLQTEVKFLGHRTHINKILAGSDVFVFPSLYEGLGGSLIEAQAAGLPVICSDLKVFHEVVNENALMFEKSNSNALGNCMVKLANSASMRKIMGEKSLVNFNQRFQLQEINKQMLDYYKSLNS